MEKICVKCGAKMADDASFCTECGAKQPVVNKCKKCGAVLDEGTAFCTSCGTPVELGGEKQGFNAVMTKLPEGKKIKPLTWIGGIIAVVIVVLACIIGFSDSGSTSKEPVKASTIIEDYIRDQGTAEKTYKDKNIKVTGQLVRKFQFSNTSDYALVLHEQSVGGKYYNLIIDIPSDKAAEANKVKEGDFVSVEGTCIGIVKQDEPTKISVQVQATKVN